VCPTNKCNLNCEFCSFRDRDKSKEIPFLRLVKAIEDAKSLGCRSLILSGGGEPFMYERINDLIRAAKERGMAVYCITNGTMLQKLKEPINGFKISYGSGRKLTKNFRDGLYTITKRHPGIRRLLSYVVYKNDYDNLNELVEFLNEISLDGIIIVSDFFNPKPFSDELKKIIKQSKHDVLLQEPINPSRGRRECILSLRMPVISADEYIYPCNMIQFAKENIPYDFPKDMAMGKLSDLKKIWYNKNMFDGSKCVRCYYDYINRMFSFPYFLRKPFI